MYLENSAPPALTLPTLTDERGKPLLRNKHHRRPRSRGGDNGQSNIVTVDAYDHLAWHQLAHNWWATTFVRQLNFWDGHTLGYDGFVFTCTPSRAIRNTTNPVLQREIVLARKQHPYRYMSAAQRHAWVRLFGQQPHPRHVCEQLNDLWVDRDYRIYVMRI